MSERGRSAPGRKQPRASRRRATTVPDILFTLTSAAWTMAVIFVVASFTDSDVTSGTPGRLLARMFAAALFASGLFVGLLGLGLLRDERGDSSHFVFPVLLGVVIGGLEAFLFLRPAESLLWLPFLLLIFALRPVRSGLGRLVGRGA